MITPDERARLRALCSNDAGAMAVGVTAAELEALLDAADLLAQLRRYEYMVAGDFRTHTGKHLDAELERVLGQRP